MSTSSPSSSQLEPSPAKPKRRWFWRLLKGVGWFCLLCVIAAVCIRPLLPRLVRDYVNHTLNQSPLYRGKIGDIDLHIWRGAYTIHDVRILKSTAELPVPFIAAKEIDLAIQWSALLHRKLVGRVQMVEPQVNFVDDPTASNDDGNESGSGGPWLKILNGLFPFEINRVELNNGSIHFRTYQKATPVDVYLGQLHAVVDNLTNVNNSVTPLLTTVLADGTAMDQAKFEFRMKLDPFSYNPSFTVGLRLIGLDITTTNDLIETYGGFDVKRGLFDLVIDLTCNEGELSGYVKPLFRNMQIFNLVQDVKDDNVLRVFWQAIVGGTAAIVTNYGRDQLATLIPISGQLQGPNIDFLSTLGNVLKNAFIRAYLPRLEKNEQSVDGLEFGPATLTDPDTFDTSAD